MKFLAIIGFAAVLSIPTQASCHHLKLRLQPWDEESCRQSSRIRKDTTIKEGHCENQDPFRSYQVLTHKHMDKLKPWCKFLIYDERDCLGRSDTYDSLHTALATCENATFPVDQGTNSGRSVRLDCTKPAPKPIVPVVPVVPVVADPPLRSSTLVPIPMIVETSFATKTQTFTQPGSTLLAFSTVTDVSTATVQPPAKTETTTLTTSPTSQKTVFHLIATPKTTVKTVVVSSKTVSTTKTFCFTDAFKKAQPTRRAEVEAC